MSATVDFCSVTERDMDTLFLSAFASDETFTKLFLGKTNLQFEKIIVENVILSKTDSDGESDITVILNIDGKKIALLIEDKINVIAMKEQCNRYSIRGKKGIANNEYSDFKVFIVCPEKYYEQNEEAKKYEHHVFYEECLKYFEENNNAINEIRIQQLKQAIEKSKHQSNTEFNEDANAFFNKYVEYQQQKYSDLDLATSADTSNGYWPRFRTNVKGSYILHKINFGFVDLTISGAGDKTSDMKLLENILHKNGYSEVKVLKTGKSASIRIEVTKFSLNNDFTKEIYPVFDECFSVVRKLIGVAELFEVILNIFRE